MTPIELEQILTTETPAVQFLYPREPILSHPSLQTYLADLKQCASQLKDEPLCELTFHTFKQYDTDGSRISYESLYFHRRRCLGCFALMAWLFRDSNYLSLTEDYLWAVCNEFTWALPAHLDGNSLNEKVNPMQIDLFAAETAQTLAEILYLLQDSLNPAITFRCREEVERRIFTPFLTRKTPYWWENSSINWAAVCGGSIGMAGIYLMNDDGMSHQERQRLSVLLSQLLPVMEHFLSGFEADGACLEGLSYWTYGMSYFTAFADLLKTRTKGVLDLLSQEKVKSIAAFQGKCYFVGGQTVSFSDACCEDTFRIGITSYLSRYFNYEIPIPPASSAAAFGSDPCARWCQLFRDFVWADETVLSKSARNTILSPEICVLPDAKWLIFRSKDRCGGAIKGGHNGEPHNHNDVGSFFFLLHGEEVLSDLGAGEYTKDTFSDKRYTIFTNSSFGHNVPVINGCGQKDGRQFCGQEYSFPTDTSSDTICASMDISAAYEEQSLNRLNRKLCFEAKRHSLTLCDSYHFTEPPVSLEERFLTRQKPEIQQGTITLYNKTGEACTMTYDASLLNVTLSTDIHYNHDSGSPETIYLLRFHLTELCAAPILSFTIHWNPQKEE